MSLRQARLIAGYDLEVTAMPQQMTAASGSA